MVRIFLILFAALGVVSCSHEGRKESLEEVGFEEPPAKEVVYSKSGTNGETFRFECPKSKFADWLTGSKIYYHVSGRSEDEIKLLRSEMLKALDEFGEGVFLEGDFSQSGELKYVRVGAEAHVANDTCSVFVELFELD